MADVYDAHDELLDRPVALKLLRGIDDSGAAKRFAEEIRLTARVNHPNIVSLYDAGEHDGSPFLVLERVTGGTLAAEMAAGPMPPRRVAEIGEQLASALSHSHAAGIVHRDVKPTNVLLTDEGSVRLADFGIAVTATATRLTVTGTIAGSAGYVSPEQVLGTGAGAASDVYALGLVLLECLTGAPPWSGTTVEVALARINSDPYLPPSLPSEWVPLLRSMTARLPEERPSIDLVGHALSRLAVDEQFDPALFPQPAPPPDRRIPAVAAMSLVVLLAGSFMTLTSNVSPNLASGDAANAAPVEAVLSPAVDKPISTATIVDGPDRTALRRAAAERAAAAAARAERRAAAKRASAQERKAAAGGTGGTRGEANPPADDLELALPDVGELPSVSTTTSVPLQETTQNKTVRNTVDSVTKTTSTTTTTTTTKAEKKAAKKAAAAERAADAQRNSLETRLDSYRLRSK